MDISPLLLEFSPIPVVSMPPDKYPSREAAGPVALVDSATALLSEYRQAVETIANADDPGATLAKLTDALAAVLKAVAKRIDSA